MKNDFPPQPDPKRQPSPTGGWSETITILEKPTLVTSSGRSMVQHCGVYSSDHVFCDEAVLWRGQPLMVPVEEMPTETEHLAGRWYWGGVLLNHFGHFLTESTSRIWALEDYQDEVDGIVFLHKRNGGVIDFHTTFFNLCNVSIPIHVVTVPTVIDELVVPGQGFGLGDISFGTKGHNTFVRDNFAKDIAPDGPERLYISRSALKAAKGGAIGETVIEQHLQAHGYEVYHPQRHDLLHQIARYKAAKKIVALDGSALHLAGFCIDPETDVAMIMRRTHGAPVNIARQLSGFTGRAPTTIDEIECDWIVAEHGRVDRHSVGQISLTRLGEALYTSGFLDEAPNWPELSDDVVQSDVKELETATGRIYESRATMRSIRKMRQERRAARAKASSS